MSAFDIQRRAVTIAQLVTVFAKVPSRRLTVRNETGAALRIYTTPDDDTTYLSVEDAFSWGFDLSGQRCTRTIDIVCYLLPAATGTVVLIWQ